MIEINDLQIKYDDFIAVDDVNIHVKEGEFFTLLGPSGSGKTTTLRAIAGFNKPSRGNIIVANEDITNKPVEKRDIGMVFQSYALFPTMTVYDNIAYGLKIEKMNKKDIDIRVRELAEMVEITNELDKNVSELSGGQQQRVAISRALAKKPKIILFDEPLSNLDARLRKQLRAELKDIQEKTKMTAVYVTHDQEEALELSDHIAVFGTGRIEQIGTPQEVYDRSATEFVCNFIGNANKLSKEFVREVISLSNTNRLITNGSHYIREEKVAFNKPTDSKEYISLMGRIGRIQYTGATTTYTVNILGTELKVLEKNTNPGQINEFQEIEIFLKPDDILQYEV
ncbi:ABC transporter ATP-binding protein [Fundicoccus culcitae]|uniref:ABC transporter ATP-binding protein n=1 Tax=Fundicoccus culcitae TaxID=2969821 RepID=A0ABY5P676_9LACT|nr:ABC transporter ATP-binding protein [Fundicoccus culcitae]UUX33885.1 ABC transporter ATP-binding protein [Fundicoccus culcitae]